MEGSLVVYIFLFGNFYFYESILKNLKIIKDGGKKKLEEGRIFIMGLCIIEKL